jgi:hypothetical protein
METLIQKHGWIVLVWFFIFAYLLGLIWQAIMQRVWGNAILKELSNARALYLKTRLGEFRVDGTHKKFSFKLQKDKAWQAVDFDQVRNIHIFREVNGGALIEFLLGDWGLWDLKGRYRDVINTYRIQITLQDSRDVPIFVLRQYEQREMWLGHLFLSVGNRILKALHLYQEGEDVAQEKLAHLVDAFNAVGFAIKVRD